MIDSLIVRVTRLLWGRKCVVVVDVFDVIVDYRFVIVIIVDYRIINKQIYLLIVSFWLLLKLLANKCSSNFRLLNNTVLGLLFLLIDDSECFYLDDCVGWNSP